ncbi:trypsin-like serine peptidase [Planktotalea sp.]|uniref:trypsin-like serine peptidase n=1 Tax=Planktotalea sp. TaxID=2029877 RepID=UPI003D6B00CE
MKRILLLASLLFAPFSIDAGQSTSLTSLKQRDDFLGLEAVGRLDNPNGFCSATLIAPDLILTAAHCVFNRNTNERYDAKDLIFLAALTDDKSLAKRRGYRVVVDPNYESEARFSRSKIVSDIALILLDDPVPTSIAAPFAIHSGGVVDGPISVVSYGRGRTERMSWQRQCNILNRNKGLFVMDCDVTFGSSGSAVFVREGSRYRILSMTSAIGKWNGKQVAYGMELGPRVDALKRTIRNKPVRRLSAEKRLRVGNKDDRQTSQARFVRVGD